MHKISSQEKHAPLTLRKHVMGPVYMSIGNLSVADDCSLSCAIDRGREASASVGGCGARMRSASLEIIFVVFGQLAVLSLVQL